MTRSRDLFSAKHVTMSGLPPSFLPSLPPFLHRFAVHQRPRAPLRPPPPLSPCLCPPFVPSLALTLSRSRSRPFLAFLSPPVLSPSPPPSRPPPLPTSLPQVRTDGVLRRFVAFGRQHACRGVLRVGGRGRGEGGSERGGEGAVWRESEVRVREERDGKGRTRAMRMARIKEGLRSP